MNPELQQLIIWTDDLFHLAESDHWQDFGELQLKRNQALAQVFDTLAQEPNEETLQQIQLLRDKERLLIELVEHKQGGLKDAMSLLKQQQQIAKKYQL